MSTIAMNSLTILAQATNTTTPPAGPTSWFSGNGIMFPLLAILVIFMFFSFNSKRKAERERKAQMESMKRGDRVKTIGGIIGTIVDVRETEVVVKVDESNNTKIKFARSAIATVTTEEDKEKDKDKEKADAK